MKRRRKQTAGSAGGASRAGEDIASPLRIVGGRFRGRHLEYSGDPRTRPMKDRVREAVFDLLGPGVHGMQAIDLFAGTGALGLEAISRGAATALFVEQHFPTAAVIGNNIDRLGIADQCEVVPVSAFTWAGQVARRSAWRAGVPNQAAFVSPWCLPSDATPWLAFVSPPYDFYIDRAEEMLQLVTGLLSASPAGSRLVVESDERFDPQLLPQTEGWNVRRYPPAVVAIFHKR